MAQFARPIADIAIGNWRRHDGSAVDLYTAIDETPADDLDYIISGPGPDPDTIKIRFSGVTDPDSLLSYVARVRSVKQGTEPVNLLVELREANGRMIVQGYRANMTTTPSSTNFPLTTAQKEALTTFTDWELWLTRIEMTAWDSLGTDTVINAETTTNSKQIRRLTWWDDKLWLGYGDVNAAVRPLFLRYWDPADSTFKTLASRSAGEQSDGLAEHMVWNNQLWVPYQDPVSTGEYVVVSADESAAMGAAITETVVHGWMFAVHAGNLYLAGSGDPPASNGGCVWRSTDAGATWTQVFAPGIAGGAWITNIFSYGGFLWVQPVNPLSGGVAVGNSYKSADGLTWTDAGFPISPTTSPPLRMVEINGSMIIKTGPGGAESNASGSLLRFDGTGTAVDISAAEGLPNVQHVCAGTGAVYLLVGGNRIYRSADGLTFSLIGTSPTGVSGDAIEVNGQDMYLAADAALYRWTMPV